MVLIYIEEGINRTKRVKAQWRYYFFVLNLYLYTLGMSQKPKENFLDWLYKRQFTIVANELKRIYDVRQTTIKVLDIGCGNGWYWQSGELKNLILYDMIELHILEAAEVRTSLREICTVHRGIAPKDLSKFSDDYFDFTTTFDVLEHFSKSEGYKLLYEMNRISKEGSSIFTPNGFVWQPPSANNPFNAHLSGWKPKELAKLGWNRTHSAGGVKLLRGPYGKSLISQNTKINQALMVLLDTISIVDHRFGFAFLAISRKKNPSQTQDL